MILKSLKIENIRSYIEQTIAFTMGTTLFEGDIGSGKSTILNAIEFALFGLGSQRGGSLLRLGTKKGSTSLIFEVDGKEYKIHRSLARRGNSIAQGDDGYIIEPGNVKISLSPTELKERILTILNFNEPPDPKAQSVIYRYSVFTPQEEMKEILMQDPDKRLQTLRKAFGIEDYKTASENAQSIARIIRHRASFFEGQVSDLDQKEVALKQIQTDIIKLARLLADLKSKETNLDQRLTIAKEKLDKSQKVRLGIESVKAQIPHYKREIDEKTVRIDNLNKDNNELTEKLSENQSILDTLAEPSCPSEKSEKELDADLKEAREMENELRREYTQIDVKLKDYMSVEENRVCPTCDREADPKEFKDKIKEKNKAKEKLSKQIEEQKHLIEELMKLQTELKEYSTSQKEIKRIKIQLKEWEERVKKNSEEIKKMKEEIDEANRQLVSAIKVSESLETVSAQIQAIERERNKIDEELKIVRKEVNTGIGRAKALKETEDAFITEISQKKEQKIKRDKLYDHQAWLSDYLVPTLDIIERQVMVNINHDFNQQFQRCFNILIEDPDLEVKIDEDFTPIVEREGYDQDLMALSGGEKTSVALAYRLALNTVVQRVSTGMKSNLLILDEPTDGFSKEQLFKVRDLLNEIKSPQTIIVSHERELENFADQVFKVMKENGISIIGNL